MITEDDDDTHYCIKCHTTISGLENYVSHRKSGCGAQTSSGMKPRTLSPLMHPDEQDFALKADDFFSLLELQSSSKKSSVQVSTSSKSNSGVLTRSKATAAIQASNKDGTASDWIGVHELRELSNEDNQTKLIQAVNSISGSHLKKEDSSSLAYDEDLDEDSNDEYDEDEDDYEEVECHNAPPRSHTGGKWKPTTSPIQWMGPSTSHDERNDWNNPPPSHTGGKWKPMMLSHADADDEEDKSAPPPGHTKGKWIPGRGSLDTSAQSNEIPPLRKSSGTVQYWCGPCNRRLASKIVYERHLKSDLHFKRTFHEREFENLNQKSLPSKTSLHEKRTKRKPKRYWADTESPEKQDGGKQKRSDRQNSIKCEVCRLKVQTHLMGKHLISHYHCRKRNTAKALAETMVLDNIRSVAQQAPFQCAACRFFCNTVQDFLQHWRSSEHLASSKSIPGFFICSFCKFECNNNGTMEEHLLSEAHQEVVAVINGSVPIIIRKISPVYCSTCGWRFRYNMELRKHCLKERHELNTTSTDKYQEKHSCTECNRVLKSTIAFQKHLHRKHGKSYFYCSVCSLTFETYLESHIHRNTQSHRYEVARRNFERGQDEKSTMRSCQYCHMQFAHVLYLKNHLRAKHPEHHHSCPKCGLKFLLSQEVTQHIKSKACNFEAVPKAAFYNCKKCPYKTNSEADYLFHDVLHSEPLTIYLNEDLSAPSTSKKSPVVQYKCPICGKFFKKGSLRCHLRLHTNERPFKCTMCKSAYARKHNLVDHVKQQHGRDFWKGQAKNVGSEDEKEEAMGYKCSMCGEIYSEKEKLHEHIQIIHEHSTMKNASKSTDASRKKTFLCSFCGKSFLKKFTLEQHTALHTGKRVSCPHEGCIYMARSSAEIKTHLARHSDERPFLCSRCNFSTKTKLQLLRHERRHGRQGGEDSGGGAPPTHRCQMCHFATYAATHLKRHMRLHTGAKPYSCPYCNYTCNNLENLRKHILLTNKHPGKCVYECRFCEIDGSTIETPFATNFAKDFRAHLIQAHGEQFDSHSKAAAYILGIYSAEEDSKVVQTPTSASSGTSSKRSNKTRSARDKHASVNRKGSPPHTDTMTNDLARPALLLTAAAATDGSQRDSELLSMVVVSEARDEVVYVEVPSAGAESWSMEGYYDVEESGTLVPFHSDDESLLVEQFPDHTD